MADATSKTPAPAAQTEPVEETAVLGELVAGYPELRVIALETAARTFANSVSNAAELVAIATELHTFLEPEVSTDA